MTIPLDDAARKDRIEELEAERQEIEAQMEMGKAHSTGRLSELNARIAEIVGEIKRLSK
jgi:hypothetical protein